MLRSASRAPLLLRRAVPSSRKQFSTSGGPFEADTGKLGTHTYHSMTLGLAVLTPVYFLMPDSMTDGMVDKAVGLLLSANVTAHSWIGLNYVATDYVPKVSKAMLGPARIANAGLAAVTFLGLAKISLSLKGGIKGCLKGLWNPPIEEGK